ncbi:MULTISPECIES: hypothetical protein [unclassified Myroides]|uniref:hypothetical protein n=1 Tax=unclassified Myroides TaxID=2642485 RepID=UPI00257834BE|nr:MULTISPECIES: hypothetical protein [unclassified Myroides]
MIYNQEAFDIRMDWGYGGVRELAPISDVIIIVDVLSFSTCVDIATARGALIYPSVGKMNRRFPMLKKWKQEQLFRI